MARGKVAWSDSEAADSVAVADWTNAGDDVTAALTVTVKVAVSVPDGAVPVTVIG